MIALDFGLKRLGLAWSCNGIILPLPAIIRKNRNQAANELDKVLETKKAKILIIGVANDEMQKRIEHFIGLLKFSGEIVFVDESLSSKEADEQIKEMNNSRTLRKNGAIDSISATIILKRYLG